jgi:hypothetical protein
MSGYVLKPADADIVHEIDWSAGYLCEGEKLSADLGWSVLPDHGGADELRVTEQQHDARTSRAVFSGGVPGRFYLISNRVRTYDDRVLARSIVMRIAVRKTAR